ncbi:hypothetical protein BDW74DRAFT_74383 [Aspergillus multicolor]|uniref:uncharacterized protein n=1 Tax=Aspergillus multicolor TaxID=41759 RepID=UPI003CCDF1FB
MESSVVRRGRSLDTRPLSTQDVRHKVFEVTAMFPAPPANALEIQPVIDYYPIYGESFYPISNLDASSVYPIVRSVTNHENPPPSGAGVDLPMPDPQSQIPISDFHPGLFPSSVVSGVTHQWHPTVGTASAQSFEGQNTRDSLRPNIPSGFAGRLHSAYDASPRVLRCEWKDCPHRNPFRREGDLLRHVKGAHVSPRSFVCTIDGCWKSFNRNDNLQEHVRRCHGAGQRCG